MNLKSIESSKRPQIVDYHIEMLSVGAADCFIIYYRDSNGSNKIILVDSGNYSNAEEILSHIREIYKFDNLTINLAIVTHPDEDHYGGFVRMLEKMRDKDKDAIRIAKFWLNNPQKHITTADVKNDIKPGTLKKRVAKLFDAGNGNLLDLIDELNIPADEKFARVNFIKGNGLLKDFSYVVKETDFLGFTIVGPTKEYFRELAPNLRYDNLKGYKYDNAEEKSDFKPTAYCLSKALDDAEDDASTHNQSSMIFVFEPEKDVRFLFCGDAGEAAFSHIPKTHVHCVKDVYWMKVPHHGSKHNLTSGIINFCHPEVAYISTEKQGHYLNQCTINALKQIGCKVYSNHRGHVHILYHGGDREGYEIAVPE